MPSILTFYPFPKRRILDSSKLNEFADDHFKYDENDRNFSKRVENSVEKGEIARYKILYSISLLKTLWENEKLLVFKRLILQTHKNQGLFGKGLKSPNKT